MTSSWTTKGSCRKPGSSGNKVPERKRLGSEILWNKMMFLRRILCCITFMVFYLGHSNQNKFIFSARDSDFWGRQFHQHGKKTLFYSDSLKCYRSDECKLNSFLSHQLYAVIFASIVILELSTDGQKVNYTSLS